MAQAGQTTATGCPACGIESSGRWIADGRGEQRLVRCPGCQLVYWAPRWPAGRAREHYEGYYRTEPGVFDELTARRYTALLARLGRVTGVGRLLDVGCGAGHLVALAEAQGWDATGLEISASGLACLRALKRERGLRCGVIDEELAEARLPAASFDVVALIEVLEHVEEPAALLDECARILRPGGCVYLTTPNYDSLSRRLLGARWRVIAEEHRCLFGPSMLRRLLGRVGLEPMESATKNLDVPHLLQVWRGQASQGPHPVSPESASQQLRHRLETVAWLRLAKRAANAALRAGGLGDTIEVLAQKNGNRLVGSSAVTGC